VHANIPQSSQPDEQLRHLLRSLVGSDLEIEYQGDYTATAREVFRSRRANCLAFTHLFVGLARELGLEVYFVAVGDLQRFEKDDDLIVVSGHMTAGWGPPAQRLLLEFTTEPPDYRQVREVSDLTAVALYYSNLGANALRARDNRGALRWLEQAVALDPELPSAWVNIGVARRRTGDVAGAETAYRRALEADPATPSAYQNLAALLRLRGEEDVARELLALADRRDNRNPYTYLDLGDFSLRHGDLAEAERFYRRALRLAGAEADAAAAMGILELSAGRTGAARKWLRRARDLAPDNERVAILARRLAAPTAGGARG
jgi:Flp pilus assembly protein TadD